MVISKRGESPVLVAKLSEWLMRSSLQGLDLESLVRGFCDRIYAAGLPVDRINLTFSMLHPLYRAMGFTWRRGQGLEVENYAHSPAPERFLKSPYYFILQNNLESLRRRLDTGAKFEFPLLDELRRKGATDYLAFVYSFGGGHDAGIGRGVMGSWTTDSRGGFSEPDLEALFSLQASLAVATKMAMQEKLAENVLTTYLGQEAGRNVLSGLVKRGDGETIRAALVIGDLRESTALAERDGRQLFTETLNRFFDALALPFSKNGGQILSFPGDGFLAIFPTTRSSAGSRDACHRAYEAMIAGTARMNTLNRERLQAGMEPLGFGIGMHVGNVMFGNVGLAERLTYSAFGAAVNEVQRLQALTRKHGRSVIASREFVEASGGDWVHLGEEQLHGISEAREVYTIDACAPDLLAEMEANGHPCHSEGELVVLSLRRSKAGAES
ncbi:adenylate/guanylate cyclase domain-containing protein [Prosthecomicrobium sp. N25]|uniref:adenylate/guanylate cyclase domain-containing protein n=1 Tax=Prosthecomicrobium sp. N25 TaxID=3129254 RepID=UPI0030774DCF